MAKHFQLNDPVKLVTFNDTLNPVEASESENNYWILIGSSGRVVCTDPDPGISEDRILVQFDCNLDELGLANHNKLPNALWIKMSDLELSSSDTVT